MTASRYARAIEAIDADLGDELVALDVNAGTTFGFNSVAADIWRRLETPTSFDELKEQLLTDYDVSPEKCSRELKQLLEDMAAEGLIRQVW